MIIEHIPGIANEIADVLSRRRDPARSSTWTLPPVLAHLEPTEVPVRHDAYYLLWYLLSERPLPQVGDGTWPLNTESAITW